MILYFLKLIRQRRNAAVRSPSFHHVCFGVDFRVILKTCMGFGFSVTKAREHFSKRLPAMQLIAPVKWNLGESFLSCREPKRSGVWPAGVGFTPSKGWRGLETSPGRQPSIDFSGSFAWANKSSRELFICASVREEIWLWPPASLVFLALWGGSSRFQSVSAGAVHAVVKTMRINESHSLLGDPGKPALQSRNGKSFYSVFWPERN